MATSRAIMDHPMKCPYCAEEIKAEATVCRYCQRDLAFFKPVMHELSQLEARVSEISSSVDGLRSEVEALRSAGSPVSPPRSKPTEGLSLRLGLVALFPALVSIGLFWFQKFVWVSLLIPLPFGFLLGAWWHGKHPKAYALIGLTVGVTEMAAALIAIGIRPEPLELSDGVGAFVIYVVGATVLFLAGGLFGDLFDSRRFPEEYEQPGLAMRVAENVTGAHKEPNKTLMLLIQALGPAFLGLLGTVAVVIGGLIQGSS
jgi:hypothetical protein